MPLNLTEEQLNVIEKLVTSLITAGGIFGAQYINKKRSQDQIDNENQTSITQVVSENVKSATENVKTAQLLVDALQEMLEDQRENFERKMEDQRENFENKLNTLKADYEKKLDVVKEEHSVVVSDMESKIITLTAQNKSLNHQITKLSFSRSAQEEQIEELLSGLVAKVGRHEEELSKRKNSGDSATDLKL